VAKNKINQDNVSTINATYTKEYCHQLELAYGNNMMSEGGADGINGMFEGVDLNHKTALDFGSGLGGVAFYLASKYQTQIIGVEVNPEMIEVAINKRPDELKNLVNFQLIQGDQKLPFSDGSFDVVYSKGVIVQLPDAQREETFKEFYRVLKKGGKLIIYDWLSPLKGQWSQEMQSLIETESLSLYAHTPQSYIKDLDQYGFKDIRYSDLSPTYTKYNQDVVDRLSSESIKSIFIKAYGETTYEEHLRGYKNIRDANKTGKGISAHFVAVK
jgi:phosphoethanolamine N-methyltransferase